MADAAREWTDAQLEELESRYRRHYAQAAREMRAKQEERAAEYERQLGVWERAVEADPSQEAAYRRWLRSESANAMWLQRMADDLSEAATRANTLAADMLNDTIPRVYAENANRAAFDVDKAVRRDTRYTMVDQDTVRHLMGLPVDNERLVHEVIPCGPALPSWESLRHDVDSARDIAWNRQRFASAITQGILQGESIPDIVKRTNDVFGSNLAAAVRAARTACTEAENAGRVNSYARAERLGIELEQEWMATLDERTRESHRHADGQRRKVGERFDVGGTATLRYPGDPTGPQAEIWNCRCSLVAAVKGADEEARERWARLPEGMTYDEWIEARPKTRDESYQNAWDRKPAGWSPRPQPAGTTGGASRGLIDVSAIPEQFMGGNAEASARPVPIATPRVTDRSAQARDIAAWPSAPDFESVNASYIRQLSKDIEELKAIPDSVVGANETIAFSKAKTPLRFMLRDYWGSMKYQAINGEMRGHMSDDIAEYAARVSRGLRADMGYTLQDGIELGKQAIANTELDSPIVVHRYIKDSNESIERAFRVGSVFEDKGFISTTTVNHEDVVGFVGQVPAYITHIYVPPGKGRGLPAQAIIDEVPHCSNYRGPMASREDEFTLAPGTRFEVLRVEGNEVWMTVVD